jgi:hypothetical protein
MNSTTFLSTSEFVLENPIPGSLRFRDRGQKISDFEKNDEFPQPEPVIFDQIREGARSLQELSSSEKTIFSQLRTVYRVLKS